MSLWGRGSVLAAATSLIVVAAVPWLSDWHLFRWAAVWFICVVGCAWLTISKPRFDWLDGACALVVGWAAIGLIWAPDFRASLVALERFGSVFLLFVLLRRLDGDFLTFWAPPAAFVAVVALVALDWASYGGMGNPTFLAEFLFVLSAALWVWWPLLAVGPIVIALAACGYLVVVGLGAIVLGLLWRTKYRLVLCSAFLAIGFALVLQSSEASIGLETRLDLWAGSIHAFFESPWIGHGIWSFAYVFPFHAGAGEIFGLIPYSVEEATYAEAPHNEGLRILVELGLIGLLTFALLAWAWIKTPSAKDCRPLFWIVGAYCLVGYPLANPATAMLFVGMCAAAKPVAKGVKVPGATLLAMLGMIVCLALVPVRVYAQAHLTAAKAYLRFAQGETAAALYHVNESYRADPSYFETRLALFRLAVGLDFETPVPREQVDTAWRIAQTASPANAALLMSRVTYLHRHDACADECSRLVGMLLRESFRKEGVRWVFESVRNKE